MIEYAGVKKKKKVFYNSSFMMLVDVLLIWTGPMVGHVGDGNFHVFFPVDQSNPDEIKTVHDVSVKMAL